MPKPSPHGGVITFWRPGGATYRPKSAWFHPLVPAEVPTSRTAVRPTRHPLLLPGVPSPLAFSEGSARGIPMPQTGRGGSRVVKRQFYCFFVFFFSPLRVSKMLFCHLFTASNGTSNPSRPTPPHPTLRRMSPTARSWSCWGRGGPTPGPRARGCCSACCRLTNPHP